jgi:hypothetical protein
VNAGKGITYRNKLGEKIDTKNKGAVLPRSINISKKKENNLFLLSNTGNLYIFYLHYREKVYTSFVD